MTLRYRTEARSLCIDEYVMRVASDFVEQLKIYRHELCEQYSPKIYRYEEVIYRKCRLGSKPRVTLWLGSSRRRLRQHCQQARPNTC